MSGLTISDLPFKMIIEILKRVDKAFLKNAALTCRTFRKAIEHAHSWPLVLTEQKLYDKKLRFDCLLKTKRRFHSVKLVDIGNGINRVINILKHIHRSVVRLLWRNSRWRSYSRFVEVLQCLPKLKRLSVSRVLREIQEPCSSHQGLFDLKELETLEVIYCDTSILEYIVASNLKTFKVRSLRTTGSSPPMAYVVVFLQSLKTLSKLYLEFEAKHVDVDLFLALQEVSLRFHLTHLGVSLADAVQSNTLPYEDYDVFIDIHSETLEYLDLCGKFSEPTYLLIFTELPKLKSLRLYWEDLPTNGMFNKQLNKVCNSLENLKLYGKGTSDDFQPALNTFCSWVPNVKNLYISSIFHPWKAEELLILSEKLLHLTTLTVTNFDLEFTNIGFPKLTSFYIKKVVNEVDWEVFAQANPGITELIIEDVTRVNFSLVHIQSITENLTLHTLKIGRGFYADERFMEIISKNCPHLKVLHLHISCGLRRVVGAISVRLYNEIVCPDMTDWF